MQERLAGTTRATFWETKVLVRRLVRHAFAIRLVACTDIDALAQSKIRNARAAWLR